MMKKYYPLPLKFIEEEEAEERNKKRSVTV
jgi:hypothetical protein